MTDTIPAPPDLLSAEHVQNPWPGLEVLRDHYPVHFDESLESWLVSRYEDIRPINRATEPGATFQELLGQYLADADVLLALADRDHRKRRALLAPFFSRSGADSFRDRIERQARRLLEPIFERERKAVAAGERSRGKMDFATEFADPLPLRVMLELTGLPDSDEDRMQEWLAAWLGAEGNLSGDPAIIEQAQQAKEDFADYIRPVIDERRTGDGDDLISWLCRAEIDGAPLSDEEIKSLTAIMIHGGGESTGHQLGWLMFELTQHPDQQRALVEDRSLMDKALAEGMRHCSILQYLPHTASEDLEVRGVTIPAGSMIALMLAAGNRDPRRWRDPDEFDIHRTDLDANKAFSGGADHLSFGGGPHFCVGSQISKAEQEIALNALFDGARDIRLADGFEARPRPDSPFVRVLANLELSFDLN